MRAFFKTSKGNYIRLDAIIAIEMFHDGTITIWFNSRDKFPLYADDAISFLQFIDNEFVEGFADER